MKRLGYSIILLVPCFFALMVCSTSDAIITVIQPNGSIEQNEFQTTPLIGQTTNCEPNIVCLRISNVFYLNFKEQFVQSYSLNFAHTLHKERLLIPMGDPTTRDVQWDNDSARYGFCYSDLESENNCLLVIIRVEGPVVTLHQAVLTMDPSELRETLNKNTWIARGTSSFLELNESATRVFLIHRNNRYNWHFF